MTDEIIKLTISMETLSKTHNIGFMDILNEIMLCHIHRIQNET